MIDRQLASFLEGGVSIHIGTCDSDLQPSGGRAAAVLVEDDGRHLVAYVPDKAIARLRTMLETHRQATVSFGRPEDERACQVKGAVLDVRPASTDERQVVERQWDGFMRQFEKIGIPRVVTAGWATWPATAVRLEVTAVFEQTPGPHAGTPIA